MDRVTERRNPRPAGRDIPSGPGRRPPHRIRAVAAATALAAACDRRPDPTVAVSDTTTAVIVDDFDGLTLRQTLHGSVLARRGAFETPLPAYVVRNPAFSARRMLAGGARGVAIAFGTSAALVLPQGPARHRDARVCLAARFVRDTASAHVDIAAPDLWASADAATRLAEAVAETAHTVRAGSATFDLGDRDGIGTWRVFARVCVPEPSRYSSGTGRL